MTLNVSPTMPRPEYSEQIIYKKYLGTVLSMFKLRNRK